MVATLAMPALSLASACLPDPIPRPPDVVPIDTIVASESAGKIDGAFSVTDFGTAAYSVPLQVPDGRAGIQPSLAIRYDSGGGNGLLGVGFGLAGLSSISRCPKTLAHDGQVAPIRFDETDRFCMDGQRLVRWSTERREYRTERDPFDRIEASDVDLLGPRTWRVHTRDGRILEYGNTRDARLEGTRVTGWTRATGGDQVRLTWALSRVRDRSGNWMAIEYQTWTYADGAVQQRPWRIRYTGFGEGLSELAPRRWVELHYEDRDDEWDGYVAGLRLRTTDRLERIEAWAPDGRRGVMLARQWRLQYRNDSVTRRSLLSQLRECDGAGTCKPPTVFGWQMGEPSHDRIATGITDVATTRADFDASYNNLSLGDIDGDGSADLFYPVTTSEPGTGGLYDWYWRRGGADGFGPRERVIMRTRWVRGVGEPALLFDQDGDSRAELLFQDRVLRGDYHEQWFWRNIRWSGAFWSFLDSPSGFGHHVREEPIDVPFPIPRLPTPQVADFDGDGTIDLLNQIPTLPVGSEHAVVHFHSGTRWAAGSAVLSTPFPDWSQVEAADIDDDGAVEILSPLADATTDDRHTAYSIRPHQQTASWLIDLEPEDCQLWADVNGDTLTDRLVVSGGAPRIRLNTGRGFTSTITATVLQSVPQDAFDGCSHGEVWQSPVRVVDFDGDGRQDLLDVSRGLVLLSRGPRTERDRFGVWLHSSSSPSRSVSAPRRGQGSPTPPTGGHEPTWET